MASLRKILVFFGIMLSLLHTGAQTFTDIQAGLTGVAESSAGWIDPDRDGDPDVFAAGEFYKSSNPVIESRVYANQRNDKFALTPKGLPDFYRGDFAQADLDLDGIIDLVLMGETKDGQRFVWFMKGTANGSYQRIAVEVSGFRDGGIDCADIDGDGDPDVVITGETSSGLQTVILRNDRNWKLSPLKHNLPGTKRGDVVFSDFNLDGLPDIFLTGINAGGKPMCSLYQNTGTGFRQHGSVFKGLKNSHMSFADADNDGDDDLLLTGENASGSPFTQLYINQRNGFWLSKATFIAVTDGFSDWGDLDLDGDMDVLLSGMSAKGPVSRVYVNDRNETFRDARAGIIPLYNSSGQWGDYDLDGDLDFVIAGLAEGCEPITRIYSNGVIGKRHAGAQKILTTDLVLSSPNPTRATPVWFYVYSSSYSDLYQTGKKDYYFFVSPVKKVNKSYVLEEKFQALLIQNFPTWPKTDQGNIVQNGFATKSEADKSRARMIHEYEVKGFKLTEINW